MPNVKKLNICTVDEVQKKELDVTRFRHNEVNFEVTYDCHQNFLKVHLIIFEPHHVKLIFEEPYP